MMTRRTSRQVAEHGDACNLYPTPDLTPKLDGLRRHCNDAGRDYDAIEKTCLFVVNAETIETSAAAPE